MKQQQFGWDHFIQGRMVISWSMILNETIHQNQIKNTNSEQWVTDLHSINWKYILSLWNHRNTETLGAATTKQED
jgi:hypothetical protein